MSAMTVHRPPQRVNTLYRVISEESPGQRLKAFVRARWTRKDGGDVALAKLAHMRRQTLQDWYAGKDVPGLPGLQALADALGVRRVDLVAAYDGVTAPEQQETPRPEWAEGLATKDDVAAQSTERGAALAELLQEIRGNRAVMAKVSEALADLSGMGDLLDEYRIELERAQRRRDGVPRKKTDPTTREKRPPRTTRAA